MKRHKPDIATNSCYFSNKPSVDLTNAFPRPDAKYVSAIEKWLVRHLIIAMGKPAIYVIFPDGSETCFTNRKPTVGLHIHERGALWKLLINPSLNIGEEFTAGRIEVKGDLVEFLATVYQSRSMLHQMGFFSRHVLEGIRRRRNNTLARARANVHHHYDIGNDFYKLWLDKELVYTCAYYPEASITLEQAQLEKMDYVCRKLNLQAGETVVEAGCGWGALALYMAKHYGVKVKAYNVSHEQIAEARMRALQRGLQDQVEFIEDDYRNITGTYDVFVSVGMLEHVGLSHYHELGNVIDKCLADNGRGLMHSIAQNESMSLNPWLIKHIFPGAYTPTLRQMMEIFEPRGFAVLDVENLRLHYEKTCQQWLTRFNQHETQITNMFDAHFVHTWRLYLAASVVNFRLGGLLLLQALFSRPNYNNIPLTRAYLYKQDTPVMD